MDSPRYILTFVFTLTALVALLLTGMRQVTMEKANLNEQIFNKRAILSAVETHLPGGKKVKELSDEEVLNIFNTQMQQIVIDTKGQPIEGVMAENIDMAKERKKPEAEREFPIFVYTEGETTCYIFAVRGNGLWDEIWGNVALESDLNTIAGVAFDHKGETPGLGAEIKDNPAFPRQFIGKQIFDDQGQYVSIKVKKGGAEKGNTHQVDAITGATITSDGVTKMFELGLKNYLPYMEQLKAQQKNDAQGMLIQ
ncbi:MAG: NADH:ubiquinone reductase (Na(+)-transporting) subunit C [Saprospirales bacterium]|nr:NADH:ubiquinone reductase (Na(+)-transporting) subunit C [Saprospirales bacterium]MBK8490745.1 NADH:ubiquinone reductase (Na(+)-transporting) subunit C [Saprospirales bacterium]